MNKFSEIFQDLVVRTLEQVYQFTVQFLPKIAISLVILLVGWFCALLLKKIVAKLFKAFGFDVISEKTGLKRFLESGGIARSPSSIIGLAFYWLIILSALVMIFNTLELEAASELIKQAVFYIPRIIVALVLLALGIFLSQFVGKFVEASSRLANIPFYATLGKVARYAIIGIAIMMALEQLGVATTIVTHSFVIIFGVVPIIISLIFLIGGRDIVSSMLAGRILSKAYKKGEKIEFDSISGQIESVDLITTKIKTDQGEAIVPNSELAKKTIKRIK